MMVGRSRKSVKVRVMRVGTAYDHDAVCRAKNIGNPFMDVRAIAPIAIHDELVLVSPQWKVHRGAIGSMTIIIQFDGRGIPAVKTSGDMDLSPRRRMKPEYNPLRVFRC